MAEPNPDRRLAVTDDARSLARRLVRAGRFAPLGTLCPATGAPLVSRVSAACDLAGRPLILISDLAAHTEALMKDPRCSLLFGEPGDGDPLAHPRITLVGRAEFLERGGVETKAARRRFLSRHPGAETYADFSDFHFVRIAVERAALNAGFARAYGMTAEDVVDGEPSPELAEAIERARAHMNDDHGNALDALARRRGEPAAGWTIVSADRRGFEISAGDRLRRIEFDEPVRASADLRAAYVALMTREN